MARKSLDRVLKGRGEVLIQKMKGVKKCNHHCNDRRARTKIGPIQEKEEEDDGRSQGVKHTERIGLIFRSGKKKKKKEWKEARGGCGVRASINCVFGNLSAKGG